MRTEANLKIGAVCEIPRGEVLTKEQREKLAKKKLACKMLALIEKYLAIGEHYDQDTGEYYYIGILKIKDMLEDANEQ